MNLIETIKYKGGQFFNLEYHEKRLNNARKALFGCEDELKLFPLLSDTDSPGRGPHKCRLTYAKQLEKIEFEPYQLPQIKSFKLIHADDFDYRYKYKDRSGLAALYHQREDCDDIIIVKNGLITDSYYANLVFDDGDKLCTPRLALLKGTKRAHYLKEQVIFEADLGPSDLNRFRRLHLINAMIDLEECALDLIKRQVVFD